MAYVWEQQDVGAGSASGLVAAVQLLCIVLSAAFDVGV